MKKLISLLLASLMACSMTACVVPSLDGSFDESAESQTSDDSKESASLEEDSASADKDNSEEELPTIDKTTEELFTLLKEANDATTAYSGPLTVTAKITAEQSDSSSSSSSLTHITASMDSATGKYYYNITDQSTYYSDDNLIPSEYSLSETKKTFIENENYYFYTKVQELDTAVETYEQILPYSAKKKCNINNLDNLASRIVGNALHAESFAELVSAYDAVYAAAKENTNVEEEFNVMDYEEFTLSPSLSIKETADGTVTLNILSSFMLSLDFEGVMESSETSILYSLSVKDGLISSLAISFAEDVFVAGETTPNHASKTSLVCDLGYDFDQTGYDAIAVTLPAQEEISVEEKLYEKEFTVMLGDCTYSVSASTSKDAPSVQDALGNLLVSIEDTFAEYSNGESSKYLTIEGLYLDEAFTVPLDFAAMNEETYLALDTVYVKYTLESDYFMCLKYYEQIEELSRPFFLASIEKLFISSYYNEQDNPMIKFYSASQYIDGFTIDIGENEAVLVNGEKRQEFVPASGNLYVILSGFIVTDKNFTFSYLFRALMHG